MKLSKSNPLLGVRLVPSGFLSHGWTPAETWSREFKLNIKALNEHTDYFKSEEIRSAAVETRVIPGGMLPNFGGDYMVRQFYIDTDYFQQWEYYDVTLATQCSANHLHHVVMQIERWTGPISVAVFAPDEQASFATDAILSMGECWPEIKERD